MTQTSRAISRHNNPVFWFVCGASAYALIDSLMPDKCPPLWELFNYPF